MPDNTQQGETEEEYYERIENVPGLFNDRNETAKEVVKKAETNLKEAQHLEKLTPLAPSTAPAEVEDDEPAKKDEVKPDPEPAKVEDKDVQGEAPKSKKASAKDSKDDATGPSGDYAKQLPAEDQAGQEPRV